MGRKFVLEQKGIPLKTLYYLGIYQYSFYMLYRSAKEIFFCMSAYFHCYCK